MKLFLNEIDVDCIVGDLPDERDRLQRLVVNVELDVSDLAGETDELDDTVDYATLTELVRDVLIKAKCRMIERAAKVVLDAVLAFGRGKIFFASVRVTKSGAITHLKSASAVAEGGAE